MAIAHHSLILELAYRACLRREADADLVELAEVSCVWQGIALVVYLLKSGGSCAVQLELEDVDVAGTFEHTVYAALARLLLHVGVVFAKELHDEVKRVLEVTLTLLLVLLALEAVGYVGEHGGELETEGVEVACLQGVADTVQPCGLARLAAKVVGGEQYQHTTAYFFVGEVEEVGLTPAVIPLDGQVAALVEHGQRLLLARLVVDKIGRNIFLVCQFVDVHVVVRHQAHEVFGCACSEPVVLEIFHV